MPYEESSQPPFQEVLDQHVGIAIKVSRAFASTPSAQEDLYQEIVLSWWEGLEHFRGDSALSTFLYRLAHYKGLNWQRSERRYQRKLNALQAETTNGTTSQDARHKDRQINKLYVLIRALPPADRSLLLLSLDQLKHRDIAEIVGISESHVGVRLHRIRHQLAEQWHKEEEPTDG